MLSLEPVQPRVVLVLLLAKGGRSPAALCCKEATVGAEPCLWELLSAEALMLGHCLSCSPATSQSCPARPWGH